MIVREIHVHELDQYAQIPISFEVRSILRPSPVNGGLGGIELIEEDCTPYTKDYDLVEGENPTEWPAHYNLSQWVLFAALDNSKWIGGAAVRFVEAQNHTGSAVLWDLRVHPDFRNRGVGGTLLDAVVKSARDRHCSRLAVETQNINVAACRFYARNGFSLGAIDLHGYALASVAHEAKLVWYMDLM